MIGFDSLLEQLRHSIKSGSLSHAHLITGPDGIGKSVFSRVFARMILNYGEEGKKENYVDMVEIRTDKLSIGVDDIRKVVSEANVKPFEGNRKVIIIHTAEKMTVQAQNAVLKTLEEPPAGVFFILVAETTESILPTIISRVQIHKLSPLSDTEIDRYISGIPDLTSETRDILKAISQGIPGKVDSFLKDDSYRAFLDICFDFMSILSSIRGLRDRNSVEVLNKNSTVLEYDPEEFFATLILISRDIMMLKLTSDYKRLIFLYNKEVLEKISQKFSLKRLDHIITVSEYALDLFRPGRNINSETVVDHILFKLLEEV